MAAPTWLATPSGALGAVFAEVEVARVLVFADAVLAFAVARLVQLRAVLDLGLGRRGSGSRSRSGSGGGSRVEVRVRLLLRWLWSVASREVRALWV